MASDKIRLGVIGANPSAGWAPRAHLPALMASAEVELTAVCTTRPESAAASAQKYGARLAFHDYRELVACPDIDAVAVVVRVPSHYEPTKAALLAGKHVLTEWPLGKTTAEAEELTALAKQQGVQGFVGLQARVAPAILYARELVSSGYVGEVLACHMSLVRDGVLQRTSDRTWQRDASLGATTLTIASGHSIDAMRFVVGDFRQVSAVVSTQVPQWLEVDTQRLLDVTAPDNILVSGQLTTGAVASVHVAAIPWAGSGYRMEIYGREGTLVVSGADSPQLGALQLQGTRSGGQLEPLDIPSRLRVVPDSMPQGAPYNVGQLYSHFARAIRTGEAAPSHATFDTAVDLHRLIDTMSAASASGRQCAAPSSH
ncbi:MAG: Gfo/Idh/MocA family protein [Candidatus Tectimicrobiota bacterium]